MQPISPCGRCDFQSDESLGMKGTSINKMADLHSVLSRWGFTQICVARGIVSRGSEDGAAGELQLWYHESWKQYRICTRKTAKGDEMVCRDIDVFTLHFQKCTV